MSEEQNSLGEFDHNSSEPSSKERDTSLGRIPVEWDVLSLGAGFSIEYGDEKPEKELQSDGYPVYGANGIIGYGDEYLFDEPVVAITCRGATCGNVHLTESQSWVTNNSLVLKNEREQNKRFLLDTLRHHSVERAISGSAQPQITATMLSKMDYPIPPLPEQRKIATVLHTVDQAIQKNREILSQIRRVKRGIIQDVLNNGVEESETSHTDTKLGKIPTNWEVTTIKDIVADEENAFTDGARYSLSSSEIHKTGEARAILLQEVGEQEFNDEDPKFATEDKYEEITHRAIYPGEVVVAKMAEPVARACIVPEKYDKYLLGCADVVRVQTNNKFDERFLMYCMNSHKVWRQAAAHLRGTGRSRINLENIAELKLPKPPIKEQSKIADMLGKFDQQIRNKQDQHDLLNQAKQGLMQDLLSGTVRTTNAGIDIPDEITQHG